MYKYCVEHLGRRLGKGSSRAAFQINDNAVIKVALNEKGVAQNRAESDWYLTEHYSYIFPKLYYEDENDRYIISEHIIPLTRPLFKKTVGIEFNRYCEFLKSVYDEYSRKRWKMGDMSNDEVVELVNNNEWLMEIYNYMTDFNPPCGDMLRRTHYGLVNRDGTPNVVLMDYGLTQDIGEKYYGFEHN